MSAQAQPDFPAILVFSMDDVRANKPGLEAIIPPATVLTRGDTVQLTSTFGFTGILTALLIGLGFAVEHHVECIETGNRYTLAGGNFTVPAPAAAGAIPYTSPTYTTGGPGSGANFEIPAAPQESGTFRILTHVHAQDPNVRPIVAAFDDGLVIEVV